MGIVVATGIRARLGEDELGSHSRDHDYGQPWPTPWPWPLTQRPLLDLFPAIP